MSRKGKGLHPILAFPPQGTGNVGGGGGGGGGAPETAQYVVLATNATLTAERVLTAGTNIAFVDAGAGSTLTVNVPNASDTVKGAVELATSVETTAGLAVQASDTRLSDSRTPTAHAASHKSGGTDVIKLDEFGATTDIITLNASTSAHGLLRKLDNDATHYLDGQGGWTVPPGTVDAPTNAQYITLATNATLTVERVLTAGTNIAFVDAGAGSTLTVNVPDGSTTTKGAVELATDGESAANVVVQGNDSRMSNARTPTAHATSHKSGGTDPFVKGDDLNASAKYLEDVADPASDAQRFWLEDATANLKYWSDEGTPVKHVVERQANKSAANGYASLNGSTKVPIAELPDASTTAKGIAELAPSADTTAGLVVQADDTRLSDSRTPTAHAASHKSGGGDAIKLDELAAPTDVATLNSSTSA